MKFTYYFQRVETLAGTVELDCGSAEEAFELVQKDEARYIYRPAEYDETQWQLTDVVIAKED